MLYLIGLGLNEKGISIEGLEAVKKCKRIYLENYTVDFPYSIGKLEKVIGKKISQANREVVESLKILEEAKNENVALLVYGNPLMATTHVTLLQEAKKRKIKSFVIHATSVFDSIAETGLQLYKFGKITSLPKWKEHYKPESFIDIIKENQIIKAHSLILVDIGLELKEALNQLKIVSDKNNLYFDKIILCSELGTKESKVFYGKLERLKTKKIKKPYCIIIPGELHFIEEEVLKDKNV